MFMQSLTSYLILIRALHRRELHQPVMLRDIHVGGEGHCRLVSEGGHVHCQKTSIRTRRLEAAVMELYDGVVEESG